MQNRSSGSDEAMRDDAEEESRERISSRPPAQASAHCCFKVHFQGRVEHRVHRSNRTSCSSAWISCARSPTCRRSCPSLATQAAARGSRVPQLPRASARMRAIPLYVLYGPAHSEDRHVHEPGWRFGTYAPESPRGVELPAGFPTLGTMLRAQGYYTAYKGKWHLSVINQKLGKDAFPNAAKALESYASRTTTTTAAQRAHVAGFGHDGVTAAEAVNLMERFASGSTGGKAWFLAVNFVNPHDIMFFVRAARAPSSSARPRSASPAEISTTRLALRPAAQLPRG